MGNFFYTSLIFAPLYVSVFWSILLLVVKKKKNVAKRFLGLFMIAASMVYFSHSVFFNHQVLLYRLIDPLYIFASLSVYPLYYLYLQLLTIRTKFYRDNLFHLLPALILSVSSAIIYLLMDHPNEYVSSVLLRSEPEWLGDKGCWKAQIFNRGMVKIVFFLQVLLYLHKGSTLIRSYKKRIEDFYSNLEGKQIDWARTLMIVFAITAISSSVVNFIGRSFFGENPGLIVVPALAFSSLLFFIGYLAHMQKHSVFELNQDELEAGDDDLDPAQDDEGSGETTNHEENMAVLYQNLLVQFEVKQIYLKPDLKISGLAVLLKSNRTYLSKLINEKFSCSFSDFVAKYRIEEAKKILQSSILEEYTLESVAEKSGFSSAASLIRTFKLFEGETPGAFRQRLKR